MSTSKSSTVNFKQWLDRKDKYEKSVLTLESLHAKRGEEKSMWFEVGVALAAMDCLLRVGRLDTCDCEGICREPEHLIPRQASRCTCPASVCSSCNRCIGTSRGTITRSMKSLLVPKFQIPEGEAGEEANNLKALAVHLVERGEGTRVTKQKVMINAADIRAAKDILSQCSLGQDQRPCGCALRSLAEHWIRWSKKHYCFQNVRLSETKANSFGDAAKSLMEKEGDGYYMRVKWTVPAKAQKGDTAKIAKRRQLSDTEKKQNALYLTLCRNHWKKAQIGVVERLEKIMRKELMVEKDDDDSDDDDRSDHGEEKSKEEDLVDRCQIERRVLMNIGLRRLQNWIVQDQEEIEEQERQSLRERLEEGALVHDGWVRKKNRLRVRLPPPAQEKKLGGKSQLPRFDFSMGKGVVRKMTHVKPANSSYQLMKHSGQTFIYAMSEDDLEQSKKQILKKGFVHKSNFSNQSDDTFTTERYHVERKLVEKKISRQIKARAADSNSSFNAWLEQKNVRENALKCLSCIPFDADDPQQWEQVGRALKSVDRSLLGEWTTWTRNSMSSLKCRISWESFSPVACDVHLPSSAIRDTFLKLLHRKKINFKKAYVALNKERRCSKSSSMDDQDEKPNYNSLSRSDFARLLKILGIVMQNEEMERLMDCLDKDGKDSINFTQLVAVTGEKRGAKCHGDTEKALRDTCMWETVCHECGMTNAFQLVSSSNCSNSTSTRTTSGSGSSAAARQRAECPDHRKRRLAGMADGCYCEEPVLNMRHVKTEAPESCEFVNWGPGDRGKSLRLLLKWSRAQRQIQSVETYVTTGEAPGAPTLRSEAQPEDRDDTDDDDDDDCPFDPTRMIALRWDPPPVSGNNRASFYLLETSGVEGSRHQRLNEFQELVRDPQNYHDNAGEPRYRYIVKDLSPNCRYTFRLRAINTFGAGPGVIHTFSTTPCPPLPPVTSQIRSTAISLSWATSVDTTSSRLNELHLVFLELQVEENEEMENEEMEENERPLKVNRDAFLETLERRKPVLVTFLQHRRLDDDLKGSSVFEALDSDDRESLEWEEILELVEQKPRLKSKVKSSKPALTAASKYVLKWCIDEPNGVYEEIYRGAQTHFVVHGLEPGQSFQFRLQVVNVDGKESLHSEPLVVQTRLACPPVPEVIGLGRRRTTGSGSGSGSSSSSSDSHSVQLRWSSAAGKSKSKSNHSKNGVHQLLEEWTQSRHPSSSGKSGSSRTTVDLRRKFARYDVNDVGLIYLSEFKALLEELGVPPTFERIAQYCEEYNIEPSATSRVISYEEFEEWWSIGRKSMTFVLQRTVDDSSGTGNNNEPPHQDSVVCYRGQDTTTTVSGLQPNRLYQFRLRQVGSTSHSALSRPLSILTCPSTPLTLGTVYVGLNELVLRCYGGQNGAERYRIEAKVVSELKSSTKGTTRSSSSSLRNDSWQVVSSDPSDDDDHGSLAILKNLCPDTTYELRLQALNYEQRASGYTQVTQISTQTKSEYVALTPKRASEGFTIECRGDVVTGDTIVFTEAILHGSDKTEIGDRTIAGRVLGRKDASVKIHILWCVVELLDDDDSRSSREHQLIRDAVTYRSDKHLRRHELFRTPWVHESARYRSSWIKVQHMSSLVDEPECIEFDADEDNVEEDSDEDIVLA